MSVVLANFEEYYSFMKIKPNWCEFLFYILNVKGLEKYLKGLEQALIFALFQLYKPWSLAMYKLSLFIYQNLK